MSVTQSEVSDTNMPNLYIIGAGCSKNFTQATHGIRGLESPTNGDFFKMARRVIENTGMRSDILFMEEIELLIKTIAPLYGGQNDLKFFSNRNLNLEDVMTLLDIDFRIFSPLAAQRLGHNESSQMRVLKDLLSRTLDYALKGGPCRKHRALAQRMKQGDIVLSLNYDILIDNALYSLGRVRDSGYKMNFFKVNRNGDWIEPNSDRSEVTLLKLHGSLNWVRCGLCGSLLLYRYMKQTLSSGTFQCPRCSSGESVAERMMIPPLHSKDYRDKDLAFLWIQADRMLKEFSKIVCIGYSFSSLDSDMSALIRRLRARRSQVPEVDFVSPDGAAEARLRSLLGIKRTNRFKNLSQYLHVS
jgi:hypothetical protein